MVRGNFQNCFIIFPANVSSMNKALKKAAEVNETILSKLSNRLSRGRLILLFIIFLLGMQLLYINSDFKQVEQINKIFKVWKIVQNYFFSIIRWSIIYKAKMRLWTAGNDSFPIFTVNSLFFVETWNQNYYFWFFLFYSI